MTFARVETQRLVFLAKNQRQIRAEVYRHLMDAVSTVHMTPGHQNMGYRLIITN